MVGGGGYPWTKFPDRDLLQGSFTVAKRRAKKIPIETDRESLR
jgi:hypothetical protein